MNVIKELNMNSIKTVLGTEGMSLRDYFAGQALMAIAGPDQWESERHVARWVYKMADAMLKARDEP